MKKYDQTGRSMIEMLGVLSIVGILSIGGIMVVNHTRMVREESQLISDTAQLAAAVRKISCQYDADYASHNITYTKFMKKSEAMPSNINYNASTDKIEGGLDTTTTITGNQNYFVITVSGMKSRTCMKMATTEWGQRNSNGCLGVSIGETDFSSCLAANNCTDTKVSSSDQVMALAKAAGNCAYEGNIVKIWFKSCR